MKQLFLTLAMMVTLPLCSEDVGWPPVKDASKAKDLTVSGRTFDTYVHGIRKEWAYQAPQQDVFIVVHPTTPRANAPLYVVLHSAGHDVISCVKCTAKVGNHDIYHAPGDFYALYLDCRANQGDWWWGGMHAKDEKLIKRNSGSDPRPVERRVIDCVTWTMATYGIDPERVYLCGISMGGSGTLGIGLRHGDLFAAMKANVPAGIEHVSNRMCFPPYPMPAGIAFADPPVVIDYSAPNDTWSFGHERFVKAMNDRRYALYFYWGPFGHANNHAVILQHNDLINSFPWLEVKRNEVYAVFTNASCNDPLPWPDHLAEKAPGQVNAFFRWRSISDTADQCETALFLTTPADLKTGFTIPREATADVSLRRVRNLRMTPGGAFRWTYAGAQGAGTADATGLITVPGLKITAQPATLTIRR